jgi:hypothetical protein
VEPWIAQARTAVPTVAAHHTAPRQGVTVLTLTVLVAAALDAAAAIARAELAARCVRTLVVFVAFVTNTSPLVAAVEVRGTIQALPALSQAAVRE